MIIKLIISIFIIFAPTSTRSARILGLFPSMTPSHLIIELSVIQTMVDRGHDVTVVTTLPIKDPSPNYRHIKLPALRKINNFTKLMGTKLSWSSLTEYKNIADYRLNASKAVLEDLQIRKLMQTDTFDLVVIGYHFINAFVGIPAHFKCPWIFVDTHRTTQQIHWSVGNPLKVSYVPGFMMPARQPLTFIQRVFNAAFTGIETVVGTYYWIETKRIYETYFPPEKYPSFEKAARNISLIFHTSHLSEGIIRPTVPAFVQIGGIQIKPKPDPLPLDIQAFLGNAISSDNGVVLLSLGMNAKSSDLNLNAIRVLFNVISRLKQNVIWKWDDDIVPGNSPNILYRKWLPQDDILAHRNLKLFISHCGLGSLVEAKYHGVPIVAIPLFADQPTNARTMEHDGFGIMINYQNLTEDVLHDAIREVLENPKYCESVQGFSKLYRDRPTSARETAAYWMEYVIRYRGAKHLQSPAVHMSTITYYGFDVFAFLMVVGYLFYFVLKFVLKCLIHVVWYLNRYEKLKKE